MSYVQNFSVSQSTATPTVLRVTDTSTGADAAITQRRIYLGKDDGTYLVPSGTTTDYIAWALADTYKEADVLDKDYSLNVRVDWLDVNNNVLYSKTVLYAFTMNSEIFYYGLTQNQASNPAIAQDQNYYQNKMQLRCNIDEANNAVTYGGDISSAQAALDRALQMINNQDVYF